MSEVLGTALTEGQKAIIERLRRLEESLPRERYADMPQWLQMQWLFERQNERNKS